MCGFARAADGHLQATGRDARGRKQHRYHPDWTAARNDSKYATMVEFASALPQIRKRVRADLEEAGAVSRLRAGGGRHAARKDSDTYRQQGIRPRKQLVRFDDAARPARANQRQLGEISFSREERRDADDRARRRASGADCEEMPGAAGQDVVPVSRQRPRAPMHRLDGGERVPSGNYRPVLHGKELQNMGGDRARGDCGLRPAACDVRSRLQTEHRPRDRFGCDEPG